MVPTIINFGYFKGQNTHFAHWSTVFMTSDDVFSLTSAKKNDMDLFKYFLDIKTGFLGWVGT